MPTPAPLRPFTLAAAALRRLRLPITLAVVASCAESSAPAPESPPEPIVVTIAESDIVLNAIGATHDVVASVTQGGRARGLQLYWWSASDNTARVSPTGRVLARSRGTTRIYAVSDSGGIDSASVTIAPRAVGIVFLGGPISLLRGRSATIERLVLDSAGVPLTVARLNWMTADTAIASVDATGRVTARAVGATSVRAEIEGSASIFAVIAIGVRPFPRLRLPTDTVVLGEGSRLYIPPVLLPDSVGATEQAVVSAVVTDTGVAWATPTFRIPYRIDGEATLQFVGRAAGTTRVRFSAPGWQDTVAVISVRPLQFGSARRRAVDIDYPSVDVVGNSHGLGSYLLDPVGDPARAVEPRQVRFASSDPSFLRLSVDLSITDGTEPAITRFDLLRAGSAAIVVTSPGVLPETVDVRTQERGFNFNRSFAEFTVDTLQVGYRNSMSLWSSAFVPVTGAEQLVTLTQNRPEVLQLPTAPVTLRWFDPVPTFKYIGLSVGVDTIIASAPGHAPDTLVVRVQSPRFPRPQTPAVVGFLEIASIVGQGRDWMGTVPISLRVTSSAPSVLQGETEYVTLPQSMQIGVRLRQTGIGVATLTLTDTSGSHPPLVLDQIEVQRSPMKLGLPDFPSGGASLGVRQSRNINVGTSWPTGGGGRSGTLRSSDTTLVRLSAGAFSTLPFAFDMESEDRPGTVWIIASSVGLTTDSVKVTVTRGLLDLGPGMTLNSALGGGTMNVLVRDAAGNQRITRDSLFLKVRSSDRNRISLADSIVVIPAGASFSGPIRYTLSLPGPVGITVVPMRPLRLNVDAGSTGFVVTRPP